MMALRDLLQSIAFMVTLINVFNVCYLTYLFDQISMDNTHDIDTNAVRIYLWIE
jgi:hypothetical protein